MFQSSTWPRYPNRLQQFSVSDLLEKIVLVDKRYLAVGFVANFRAERVHAFDTNGERSGGSLFDEQTTRWPDTRQRAKSVSV